MTHLKITATVDPDFVPDKEYAEDEDISPPADVCRFTVEVDYEVVLEDAEFAESFLALHDIMPKRWSENITLGNLEAAGRDGTVEFDFEYDRPSA